jgi:ATP-binding cassette subfamily B protein
MRQMLSSLMIRYLSTKLSILANRNEMAFIIRHLQTYRLQVAATILALIITSLTSISIPAMLGLAVDSGFSSKNTHAISAIFIKTLLLVCLLALSTGIRFYYVSWLGERIIADLRRSVYSRILCLSPRFFSDNPPAEIASRFTTDMALIDDVVGSTLSIGLRNLIVAIIGTAYLFTISISLSLIVICSVPLLIITAAIQGKAIRQLSISAQLQLSAVGARTNETLKSISVVKAFGQETHEEACFSSAVNSIFLSTMHRVKRQSLFNASIIIAIFVIFSIVLWWALRELSEGLVSRGEISAFFLVGILVAEALSALAEVYNAVSVGSGAISRVSALLNESPVILDRITRIRPDKKSDYALEFNDVSFSFSDQSSKKTLNSVSFAVKPRSVVAIVGKSGAGKSTLLDLVERFYDPINGNIFVSNRNIRDISLQELRKSISVVFQDTKLLSLTVRENVAYGCPQANDEQIWAALHAANASQFIQKMPLGLDTYLTGGGLRLSGGERQRLAIARAMLRDSTILLLDEATSALDAESERLVQEGLQRLMNGRTVVIVAHKLSTVQRADLIIVLDNGEIIETGRHNELVSAGGLYAKLAASQFLSASPNTLEQ